MKKVFLAILALVLCLALAVPAFATEYLSMATGGTGGTYYALGADIANMLTKVIADLDVTASIGNGSASNIREIDAENADLAFSQNDVATYAWNGIESMEGEQYQSFGVIGNLYPEVVQAAFCDDTGIKSIADFAGRRISIGAAGSGVYQSVLDFLGVSGLTLDDIQPNYLSFAESADAIKNGQIDAAFVTAGIPNPSIQDLASVRDIEMLSLSEEAVAALCEAKPYTPYTIAAGTYKGQANDAHTVSINALLLASQELDEEVVYNITKAIYESTALLSHSAASFIKLETALDGYTVDMLHPGAARYYREKGLIE